MGNCASPSLATSSSSSGSQATTTSLQATSSTHDIRDVKRPGAAVVPVTKRTARAQKICVMEWLSRFQGFEGRIEEIRKTLLGVMGTNTALYKSWKIDRLIGEVYYKNVLPVTELISMRRELRELASRLTTLINECGDEQNYKLVEADKIEQLEHFIDRYSVFIQIAKAIPEFIEEKQPASGEKNTVSMIFPELTASVIM